jgi:hypothetical protein|tara:strand:- start:2696 stop:3745 length:1050 start_codon:yes stop_codon:yes gene_type:complete
MAATAFTKGLCQKLQTTLNRTAGENAPSMKRDRVGYLEALLSDANTAGIEQIPVETNGKNRMVQIDYIQRGTGGSVTNGSFENMPSLSCDGGTEVTPKEQIVEVKNLAKSAGLDFYESEMRKLCEGDDVWVSNVLMSQMNSVNVELNKYLLAQQALNFGKFADGTAKKDIKLFEDTTNAQRGIATAKMRHEYDKAAASGAPIIVAGGNFDLYAKMNQIACCNELGADLARWTDYQYYYDRFVDAQVGANEMIMFAPGAVQLVTWNAYVGDYAKRNDVFEHGTLTDPFTGLTYDIKIHYDDCKDKWSIQFGVHFEVVYLPADGFGQSDDLNGVNYTFNFGDCSTIEACPA